MKRSQNESVRVMCPVGGAQAIVSMPMGDLPAYPDSTYKEIRMVIGELLDEGKSN